MRLLIILMLQCFAVSIIFAAERRPNILVIYADDQPYKTVSCYPEAQKWVRTPHIEALAATGVRFERAYLGAWCMPSRASMLTGRLQHAIQSMRMAGPYPRSTYDPKQTPFVAAEMRKQGYHTAQIGKWHTGVDSGFGRDWDHQIVWNRPKYPENNKAYYNNQQIERDGVVEKKLEPGYSTDNYTKWAVEYIEDRAKHQDKPWFLWLCYGAIHDPTTPAERHLGHYANELVTLPSDLFGPRPDKPAYLEKTQVWVQGKKDGKPYFRGKNPTLDDFIKQMNECTLALDEGVGRLTAALKETGQYDNTLVIYTADQGFAMGEHGLRAKFAPYDASISSPLIISRPGLTPPGSVCVQPVNAPDLVATWLAQAGVTVPWVQGHDLTPLLRDPSAVVERPMLMTSTGEVYGHDLDAYDPAKAYYTRFAWYAMLRYGHFKYVRYLASGQIEELYDLQNDPDELVNLAVKPEHAERLAKLRAMTLEELRATDAGFIERLPPVPVR